MKIYEVLYIWSCSGDDGFETYHFNNYAAALNKFKDTIKDELLSGTSWICETFDEKTGELKDGEYELFNNNDYIEGEQELYWQLYKSGDKDIYSQVYLKIFEETPPKQVVYEVVFDWSIEDDANVETHIFSSYKKAKEVFDRIIEDEKDPYISWVGESAFDENGKLNEDYELDCNTDLNDGKERNLFWCIKNINAPEYYDNIYLNIKELDQICPN